MSDYGVIRLKPRRTGAYQEWLHTTKAFLESVDDEIFSFTWCDEKQATKFKTDLSAIGIETEWIPVYKQTLLHRILNVLEISKPIGYKFRKAQ